MRIPSGASLALQKFQRGGTASPRLHISMLLTLSLFLFAQAPAVPTPQQPAAQPQSKPATKPNGPIVNEGHLGNAGVAVEFFDLPVVSRGFLSVNSATLNASSIAEDGQGPNLVLNGCNYTTQAGGSFTFVGAFAEGNISQAVRAETSDKVSIEYHAAQSDVSVLLHGRDGFPDIATVTAFNSLGNVVDFQGSIDLPGGATRFNVRLAGSDIVRIDVSGTTGHGFSPMIDNHNYLVGVNPYEDFEKPFLPLNSRLDVGRTLDDTTILSNGDGPFLVKGGVSYSVLSPNGRIFWAARNWYEVPSQAIHAASLGPMVIDYSYDQAEVSFTLSGPYADERTATVTAFDRAGNVLSTDVFLIPYHATDVPVVLTSPGIARVELEYDDPFFMSSPFFDNHDYDSGPAPFEEFELFPVSYGNAAFLGTQTTSLDSTTIDDFGNGPDLIEPGATYSSANGFQWNGEGWFGQRTRTILSLGNTLTIDYAAPQSELSFTLNAFSGGYPDVANCYAYDAMGNLVDSVTSVVIRDAFQVPVALNGPDIVRVEVVTLLQTWGALFDNHDYSTEVPLQLDIAGPCPGTNAISITGGAPGKTCRIMYSTSTAGSVISTGACAGSWTDLGAPVRWVPNSYTFDAAGEVNINRNIPASACGRIYVQVIDSDCRLSNVFAL